MSAWNGLGRRWLGSVAAPLPWRASQRAPWAASWRGAGAAIARRRLPLARLAEMLAALGLVALGVVWRATNLFGYPRYQLDEGTYIASAWSVLHGQLSPYTYNYGHPPAGWALIALWIQATGGFFSFGTAVNSGRVFMVVLFALDALLVYLIARRLTSRPWAALLALALFALSPLGVNYQREVLLDNTATFWMLVALYLLVASKSRLRFIIGAAVAFALAVLSKETLLVLLPALMYGTWLAVSAFQRRFAVIVFTYAAVALISFFPLLALLKGEMFPSGTWLGGTHPHVSFIDTYLSQVARGTVQGSLAQQWASWWHDDCLLIVAGMLGIGGTLLHGWRRPALRVVPLAAVSYWLFLARGGVTLGYYILPELPLLALCAALLLDGLARLRVRQAPGLARLAAFARGRWGRRMARRVVPALFVLACLLLIPWDLRLNHTNLTVDATAPETQALAWVGQHVPPTAVIVANHYAFVDLRIGGGYATPDGVPFSQVQMYWQVATDPAIHTGLLHDDWNNIDYVLMDSDMTTDINNFQMAIIQQALKHATIVKTFANGQFHVTIYQVTHRGA